jgi:hypothetical protein
MILTPDLWQHLIYRARIAEKSALTVEKMREATRDLS